MTPGFSHYLDLLRVIAALIVLASHMAYARFTRGDYAFIHDWNLGSDAVILFFVLSGYVIAYTAYEKDRSLAMFAFARLTRLYSVVIPAILITLALDYLGSRLDPDAYSGWWWNPAPAWETLLRTLTFTTEWTANAFRPGTNGPFWSLSYEAAYYALFAIAMFVSGWQRIVLLAAVLAIVGIKVLLLIPSWLLGVWLYYRTDCLSLRPIPALIGFIGPILLYIGALAINVPDDFMALTVASISKETVNALRFSNEFLWNALLGLLVTLHLIAALSLFQRTSPKTGLQSLVHWLSGASFSIYIVHYPALQFWHAILPDTLVPLLRDGLLFGTTLLTCLVFASIFERRLPQWRRAAKDIGHLISKAATPIKARRKGMPV